MKIILILLSILCIPIVIFEYFILLWFWGGDGFFTLVASPIAFVIVMGVQLLVMMKCINNNVLKTVLMASSVITTPILTMLIVHVTALIFGVEIVIM